MQYARYVIIFCSRGSPKVPSRVWHLDLTDNTRPHLTGGLERRRSVELGSGSPPPPARILRCRRRLSISGMEFLGDLEGGTLHGMVYESIQYAVGSQSTMPASNLYEKKPETLQRDFRAGITNINVALS